MQWAWWLVMGLAAMSVLPVLFGGEFVLDDVRAVTRSACIREGFDLTRLTSSNFWCEPEGAQTIDAWRPLPMLIWWPMWRISGGSPLVFHLFGLALHVITSLGLVRLLLRLDTTPRAALLAGVLYAVLPIHVDATASVVGQAETLAGALGVWSLVAAREACLVIDDDSRRRFWLWVSLGLLFLAMTSKEGAIVLAPVLVLVWSTGTADSAAGVFGPIAAAKARWRWIAAAAGVALFYLLVRATVVGAFTGLRVSWGGNPTIDLSFVEKLRTAIALTFHYHRLAVVGDPLSADYSWDSIPVGPRAGLVQPLLGILLLVTWLGWMALDRHARSRRDALWVLAPWWVGSLVFLGHLVSPLPVLFAERFAYTPTLALCGLVGIALDLAATRWRDGIAPWAERVLLVGVGLWGVLALGLAMRHAAVWRTKESITLATVEACPNNARAHVWRARVLGRGGDPTEFAEHAHAAARIAPQWAAARALRGVALDQAGQPKDAFADFLFAFEREPWDPEVADLFRQFLLRYGNTMQAAYVEAKFAEANGRTLAEVTAEHDAGDPM